MAELASTDTDTDDALYRDAASELWARDELDIEADATVSAGDGGAWVQAWVWVSNAAAGIEEGSEA